MTGARTRPPGKSDVVRLDGAEIEYFGSGRGPGVVLLPGGSLPVGYMEGLALALAGGRCGTRDGARFLVNRRPAVPETRPLAPPYQIRDRPSQHRAGGALSRQLPVRRSQRARRRPRVGLAAGTEAGRSSRQYSPFVPFAIGRARVAERAAQHRALLRQGAGRRDGQAESRRATPSIPSSQSHHGGRATGAV